MCKKSDKFKGSWAWTLAPHTPLQQEVVALLCFRRPWIIWVHLYQRGKKVVLSDHFQLFTSRAGVVSYRMTVPTYKPHEGSLKSLMSMKIKWLICYAYQLKIHERLWTRVLTFFTSFTKTLYIRISFERNWWSVPRYIGSGGVQGFNTSAYQNEKRWWPDNNYQNLEKWHITVQADLTAHFLMFVMTNFPTLFGVPEHDWWWRSKSFLTFTPETHTFLHTTFVGYVLQICHMVVFRFSY